MSKITQSTTPHKLTSISYVMLRISPFLVLGGLLLLFFNKMAFSNLILARGDTFLYFYPYWQAAAEALANGRVPLWNAQLFMGSPLLANSQVGFFYPLNWPVWLLLATPYAVSASILLHVLIAGWGAYLAGRSLLNLDRWAGLLTAVCFSLGGYLTAQVEHINQLQGLAWLPWFFVVMGWCSQQSNRTKFRQIGWTSLAFASLFSLQLLAGHTQTTFITGVTMVVWLVGEWLGRRFLGQGEFALQFSFRVKRLLKTAVIALFIGGVLALLVTAVQLLPTLELSQHSSRQGGLAANEVLSFSLHPLLLTRAVLPAYGQSMFSEYIAFLPITAVILALIGGWQWRRWPGVFPALLLLVIGLLLAFGVFNPVNWLLARLPGFNLFRVPARWLVVYTFGLSLLAGVGFQVARDRFLQRTRPWSDLPERAQHSLTHIERPLRVALFLIIGLMAWNALAGFLAIFVPLGPESPFEQINLLTLLLWAFELLAVYVILTGERPSYNHDGRFKIGFKRIRPLSPLWLFGLLLCSLFLATRTHPYNNLTTPEAYFDVRPPIARLQAAQADNSIPSRFLSLSNIFFDVGDQAEIDTIYADQLPAAAQYDYTVAMKQKEIVGPNLPMVFDLAAIDGFDGGILPLQSYSQLMQLILPAGTETTDGRLREQLTAVPEAKWLDLFNVQHLITDKTGDTWRDGVFFDLQHPLHLQVGDSYIITNTNAFPASALMLLVEGEPGEVIFTTEDGELWPREAYPVESGLVRADWPPPYQRPRSYRVETPQTMTLRATQGDWHILAATLINEEDDTFLPVTLGNYRQIHSGDVKIYENLDVLPRAFAVSEVVWQPDVAASIVAMQADAFDPRDTAVIIQADGPQHLLPELVGAETAVEISHYEPGKIIVQVETDQPAFLVLTEAYYPGWQARVDGLEREIYRTDGYFQGILVESGDREIVFTFVPNSFVYGRWLTLLGLFSLLILIITLVFLHLKQKHPVSNRT